MLRCTFSEYVARANPADVEAELSRLDALKKARGSRAATDELIKAVGLASWEFVNEAFYEEALHYYLGLLHAHRRQPQLAEQHIELSHTTPGGGGDVLFELHTRDSLDLAARKTRAQERGIPSLLISAMPRSASATLIHNLSQMLDVPVMRLSAGEFPDFALFRSWVRFFFAGGAITHDHFGATTHNVRVLEDQGVERVYVLVRDPRAAAASAVRFHLRFKALDSTVDNEFEELMVRVCQDCYLPWLRQWLEYDRSPGKKFSIHWITYREVSQALPEALTKLCATLPYATALMAYGSGHVIASEPIKSNFVEGDDEAWRRHVQPEVKARLWEACSPEMIALLELKP